MAGLQSASSLDMRDFVSHHSGGTAPKEEGLIRRTAAVGMIVQDPNPPMVDLILHNPHGHGPLPWVTCCELAGVEGRMVTGDVTTGPTAPDVAQLLGLGQDAEVVTRERHATIGDQIVRLDKAFYPVAVVQGTPIARRGQVAGGIYNALTDAGRPPVAITQRIIGARPAADAEAKALWVTPRTKVIPRTTVLTYDQVITDKDGQPIELLRFVANPSVSGSWITRF